VAAESGILRVEQTIKRAISSEKQVAPQSDRATVLWKHPPNEVQPNGTVGRVWQSSNDSPYLLDHQAGLVFGGTLRGKLKLRWNDYKLKFARLNADHRISEHRTRQKTVLGHNLVSD
jgi:hypothetical protein